MLSEYKKITFIRLFFHKREWVYIVFLCVAVLLAFSPGLFNDFQQEWDDQWMLLDNPTLLYPSWDVVVRSFFSFYQDQYSPLNQLSYLGIHQLSGFDPFAFHLGSVIVHMIDVVLVYILIGKIMKLVNSEVKLGITIATATIIALIFAIHPLQVESVAWISASKVILYTTFTLLGLLSGI